MFRTADEFNSREQWNSTRQKHCKTAHLHVSVLACSCSSLIPSYERPASRCIMDMIEETSFRNQQCIRLKWTLWIFGMAFMVRFSDICYLTFVTKYLDNDMAWSSVEFLYIWTCSMFQICTILQFSDNEMTQRCSLYLYRDKPILKSKHCKWIIVNIWWFKWLLFCRSPTNPFCLSNMSLMTLSYSDLTSIVRPQTGIVAGNVDRLRIALIFEVPIEEMYTIIRFFIFIVYSN